MNEVAKDVEVVETETTEVVEAKPQTITPHSQDNSVEGFISAAIQQQLPVETIERFLAMRKEIKEDQAKEAFTMAMAKFQADCPVIAKTKPVKNKNGEVTYRYAPLDSIILQVKKPLADNELSYSFDEKREDGKLIAICTITHSMGHSKSASFEVEVGTEAYMTDTQKYGARMTFAKRYAFCNVLGIATGDEDTDAKEIKPPKPKAPVDPKAKIIHNLKALGYETTDKEVITDTVQKLTQLDLVAENYEEIVSRLEILVQENNEG